jgi:hypothetical protein
MGLNLRAFDKTILADSKAYAILQPRFYEFDFVAGSGGPAITTGENPDALALLQKMICQPNYQWRFARSANRQIADADDRRFEALALKKSGGVKCCTCGNDRAVE